MTRDEILALPAGAQLDALVAAYVMGWRPRLKPPAKHIHVRAPAFSTDIAAAWEVVTKLIPTCQGIEIGNRVDGGWYCLLEALVEDHDGPFTIAATAPLAICRAALLAVATS